MCKDHTQSMLRSVEGSELPRDTLLLKTATKLWGAGLSLETGGSQDPGSTEQHVQAQFWATVPSCGLQNFSFVKFELQLTFLSVFSNITVLRHVEYGYKPISYGGVLVQELILGMLLLFGCECV